MIDKGLAANAGAWYQGVALDATRFGVYASPRPGTGLSQLEQALDGGGAREGRNGRQHQEQQQRARESSRHVRSYTLSGLVLHAAV